MPELVSNHQRQTAFPAVAKRATSRTLSSPSSSRPPLTRPMFEKINFCNYFEMLFNPKGYYQKIVVI